MAAATTAARAPSTRTPTAPTVACANRCHYRQLGHPPAMASAWTRAPTPIATTAAPAPSSRCARTAPTVWAVDRANSCHHRLPACAPLRALECMLTAPIATTAVTPATTVAAAPSSPFARMAPTARTAPRAHSRPRCSFTPTTRRRSCAQAAQASSCATSACAFAPPRGSRACGRRWQRCALGCGGVAQLWQRALKAGVARLCRLLEAKSVRPQPVPRLGLPHALHPAGERHGLDTA